MKESFLHVSRVCDNDCIFCGFPQSDYYLQIFDLKQKVLESKKKGCNLISLTGGEPLLYPRIVELISFINSQGLESRITTNGLNASKGLIDDLKFAGLNYFAFSVHSLRNNLCRKISSNDEYSLSRIFNSINYSMKKGISVYINTTIFRLNYKEIPNIMNFLVKKLYGSFFVNLNYVVMDENVISDRVDKVFVKISDVEPYLKEAMNFLSKSKINFRVERVPLCFMGDFYEHSSEYNRIQSFESPEYQLIDRRVINKDEIFLDYRKPHLCKKCKKNKICLGLHKKYVKKFGMDELKPFM